MKIFYMLLILFFLLLFSCSCKKDDKIPVLSYMYDQINYE
jgi:hypothetical protein